MDTSAWLALNDKSDQYHKKAISKSKKITQEKIELITSEYIVDETLTIIRYRVSHPAAVIFGESLFNSNIVKINDIAKEDILKAWDFFKKYKDKDFSFTDCTSFTLMQKLRLSKAFTFDKHFKQIGIEII